MIVYPSKIQEFILVLCVGYESETSSIVYAIYMSPNVLSRDMLCFCSDATFIGFDLHTTCKFFSKMRGTAASMFHSNNGSSVLIVSILKNPIVSSI